jgi:hypothetical protein
MSIDGEGNAFNPLADVAHSSYDAEEREVGILELTDALRDDGYGEEDVKETPAVVLWPS